MARQLQVRLIDDLDGGIAHQTIPFSLDGVGYVIDLSDPNAETMRTALARYTHAALKVNPNGGRPRPTTGPGPQTLAAAKADRGKIRAWARSQGITMSDRGSIRQAVLDAYANRDVLPTNLNGAKKVTTPAAANPEITDNSRIRRTSAKKAAKMVRRVVKFSG